MKGWGLRMNRPPKTKLSMALGGILLTASASALVLLSPTSHAAGLGKLSVNSALGQPLSAEIELVSLQPGEFEALVARVASPESYTDAKVEYSPLLRTLRFSAERRADGKPILKITSNAPVNEPFLDVLVEMNWPAGRLLREYPILLDPPGFNEARVSAPVATVTAASAVRPVVPAKNVATVVVEGVPSATAESAADTYGPVKRGDTLNKIASGLKPDGISLEQMLVALYRENKAAFINNNMNQLKTGQILRVPSAADVGKIAKREAQSEIQVQVADWKGYREQVAGAVATSAGKAASNEATGKIAVAKPASPTPAAPGTDQLKIAKTEVIGGKAGSANAGGAAGGKNAAQDQLNAMKEDAIAKDNKIKEANSRVADLEKQIADMRKLIELKGIAVPAKPEIAKVAPPVDTKVTQVVPPIPAVPAPVVAAAAVVAPAVKPADAAKAADATKPANAPKDAEAPKVITPAAAPVVSPAVPAAVTPGAPAVPAKAPVKTTPPPAAEPGFIEENAVALGAGIFALVAAGVLLAFMSRRRKKSGGGNTSQLANTSSIMPSDLKPNSSLGNRGGGLVDTGNSSFLTDFDKTGPGSMDTDEVDPVAEAEVYIAYGRDAQAEEILKEAMTRDKSRHEIAFKLLEIYHTRKSIQAFETVARELKETAGVDHPLWAKAAAMGASIDPGNSLYRGVGQAYAATGAFVTGGAAMVADAEMAGGDKSVTPPDLDFDLGFTDQAAADVPLDIAATRTGEQAASVMDFDLDLNTPTNAGQPSEKPAALDFDLEFDTAPVAGTAAPLATAVKPTTVESSAFDFDLSALSLDEPVHAAVLQEQFSSTIVTATTTTVTAVSTSATSAISGLSLSDLSLDLEGPDASGSVMSASSGGANAVATKLELAKAYIEIGDSEGAKDILGEVAREGNAAQQEEVKKILAGL